MNIFYKKTIILWLLVIIVVFLVVGFVWAYNAGTNISVTTSTVSQPACYSGTYSTPTLNWAIGFNPANPIYPTGSSQVRYEIEIDDDSNFGSINIDTGEVVSSANSYTVGVSGLSFNTNYYWRIRIMDNFSSWTDWASGLDTIFTTNGTCNSVPIATNLDRTVSGYCTSPAYYFSWTYTDPDSNNQSRYQFQVDNNSNFSSPEVNRDYTGLSNPSPTVNSQTASIVVSPGSNQIAYNTTYYWRVKVYDAITDSGWISGSSFTTASHMYPTIDFNWIPVNPSQDEDTLFSDLSTIYGGATKSAWSWTFENGSPATSNVQNPTIQFTSIGDKQITLQLTDSDSYSCSESKTINIQTLLSGWEEK